MSDFVFLTIVLGHLLRYGIWNMKYDMWKCENMKIWKSNIWVYKRWNRVGVFGYACVSHILTFSQSHILTFSHSHNLTLSFSHSHILTFSYSHILMCAYNMSNIGGFEWGNAYPPPKSSNIALMQLFICFLYFTSIYVTGFTCGTFSPSHILTCPNHISLWCGFEEVKLHIILVNV